MKEYFREIYDDQSLYDNTNIKIKILRVLIRYLVRIFGIRFSRSILGFIYIFFKSNNFSYPLYILKINIFRIKYLIHLSNNDFSDAINTKKIWADYVSLNSPSIINKANADYYLNVVYGNYDFKQENGRNLSDKKFYIYGPGCTHNPNPIYSDFTLVHLKPFPEEIPSFKKEILFLNSYYFTNEVEKNEECIKYFNERYSNIYLSCMASMVPKGFERVDLFNPGYISSEMALQRILNFLCKKHGRFKCVIEGFNFYLDKDAYRGRNYHKLTRKRDGNINEKELCMSLAEHDFLFNFIVSQKLIKNISLIDSNEFQDIISLDSNEYMMKLFKARDFKSLRRLN